MIQLDSGDGDVMLAAFICCGSRSRGTTATELDLGTISTLHEKLRDLESVLAAHLPLYMIPTVYIPLQHLPLTSSGKTDRRRLHQLGAQLTVEQLIACSVSERTKRLPSTEVERRTQQLWAGVLSLEPSSIGLDDSFFRLGGDSIKAMRLVAAARDEGVILSVAGIFQTPTLSGMSKSSEVAGNNNDMMEVEPFCLVGDAAVESIRSQTAIICSVEIDAVEDIPDATDFQILSITTGLRKSRSSTNYLEMHFSSRLDKSRMETACRLLIAHHPILRTVFIIHQQQLLQVVLRSPQVSFLHQERMDSSEELIQQIIDENKIQHLKLGQSMIQFIQVDYKTGGSCLIFRVSQAQYDGVSLPIILKDLAAAYLGQELSEAFSFAHFVHG